MNDEFKKIVLQEDISYLIDCLNRTRNEKKYQLSDDHLIFKERNIRKLELECDYDAYEYKLFQRKRRFN